MDEIEEFLRQAAARRKKQTPRSAPEIQYVEPVIIEAELIRADLDAPPEMGSVSARQLDTSEFNQRSAHMGERPAMADDVMEAHLKEKFAHQVGSLAGGATQVATHYEDQAPVSPAAQKTATPVASTIIEMFRTPANVRNAIILHEILQRPEDRW